MLDMKSLIVLGDLMTCFSPDKEVHLNKAIEIFRRDNFKTRLGRDDEEFPLYVKRGFSSVCGVHLVQNTEPIRYTNLLKLARYLPINTFIFYLRKSPYYPGDIDGVYFISQQLDSSKRHIKF